MIATNLPTGFALQKLREGELAGARINTNIKLLKPVSAHSCIRGKKILREGEQAGVVQ